MRQFIASSLVIIFSIYAAYLIVSNGGSGKITSFSKLQENLQIRYKEWTEKPLIKQVIQPGTTCNLNPFEMSENFSNSKDSSPEFTPSMLHNRQGPFQFATGNSSSVLPSNLMVFLGDRRVLALFCLFLPPLAVFLQTGMSRKFGLSLLLFAFFFFPGVLYSLYVTFLERSVEDPKSPPNNGNFNV